MEYLLIILAVGWLVYKFGRFYPQLEPAYSPSMAFDDVIVRGQLHQNLNRHMETIGTRTDVSLALRMIHFLTFGTQIAKQAADIPTPTDEMDAGPESAAILLFVQQGIHTLMTLEMGPDAITTHNYKASCAEILENATWQIFRYEHRDATDARGHPVFTLGAHMTILAQTENADLLQQIFDAWDLFLREGSNEAVEEMGSVMREAVMACLLKSGPP